MTPITDQQLCDFAYTEARTLDALRFDDWLDMFTDEDKLLLKVRIDRLHGKRTYSQQPQSRCHHLLQQPQVLARDDAAGQYTVHTAFHYVETRGDQQQLHAGWNSYHLVREGEGANQRLRMRLKKVQLVNCDAAFGSIQLFM